eukprot:3256551-Rhodomonas_salina.3
MSIVTGSAPEGCIILRGNYCDWCRGFPVFCLACFHPMAKVAHRTSGRQGSDGRYGTPALFSAMHVDP